MRQLFELYARGDRSDRSLAIWLNAQSARTTKGRPFTKDTVREIDSLEPHVVVDVTEAARALTNFGLFWERETEPGERNKLLRLVFDKVWADNGRLVAVRPRDAFLPYFQFGVVEESG